ncbi:MAG: hypothetical protein CSB46_02675, partial [Micrococcales bacterium]
MSRFLQLDPAVPILHRDAGSVQVGLNARDPIVISGLTRADYVLLRTLTSGLFTDQLTSGAAALGISASRARELLRHLRSRGALVDAEAARQRRRRRESARVIIEGGSRTGLAIALALRDAGVDDIHVHDPSPVRSADLSAAGYRADQLGNPREQAAAALLRAHPLRREHPVSTVPRRRRTRPSPMDTRTPKPPPSRYDPRRDIVVVVRSLVLDPNLLKPLVFGGITHLSVVIGEGVVGLGPFVLPGGTCCANCIGLHRTELDSAWPSFVAQLARDLVLPEEPEHACSASAHAVCAVLAYIDGAQPLLVDATLDVRFPDGQMELRQWQP